MSEDKKKIRLIDFMVKKMESNQYNRFEEFCNSRGVSFGQAIPFLLEAYDSLHSIKLIQGTELKELKKDELKKEKGKEEKGRFG